MKHKGKIVIFLLFIMVMFSFVYGESEDVFVVLLEDGTIELRTIEKQETKNAFYAIQSVLDVTDQMEIIARESNVTAVSLNSPVYLAEVPTDINSNDDWRFEVTHMNNLWSEITDNSWMGTEIVVAVLDTGIKVDHSDINIIQGVNVTGGDVNDVTDTNGHGSHVSGIIGAKRDQGIDAVVGIAPNVKIMPIKVFPSSGGGSISYLATGIEAAIDAGVDVINMSLSYAIKSDVIEGLLVRAEAEGIIVVAASSNDSNLWLQGENFDEDNKDDHLSSDRKAVIQYYPSAIPTVLSVGSVAYNETDKIGVSDFSNVGGYRDSVMTEIDVLAPGSVIYSSTYNNENYATGMSGTSMATPHVSGMAALLIRKFPDLSHQSIRAIIRDTADATSIVTPSEFSKNTLIGQGLINIEKAFHYNPMIHFNALNVSDFTFDESVVTYEIQVDKSVDEITFNEIELIETSTLTVNDEVITNDAYTSSLNIGENVFIFKGTLGLVTTTYKVTVNRGMPELNELKIYNNEDETLIKTLDVNLETYTVWIAESMNTIRIEGLSDDSVDYYLNGEKSSGNIFSLENDPSVVIKVYNPSDTEFFHSYEIKFIKEGSDLALNHMFLNDVEKVVDLEDLGFLSYGSIKLGIDAQAGSKIFYQLNDNDLIEIQKEETLGEVLITSNLDGIQRLKVKIFVSEDRYKWYSYTFRVKGNFDFDLGLSPKDPNEMTFLEDFVFDLNTNTYDLLVASRMTLLSLNIVAVDDRLVQSVKINGLEENFINTIDLSNFSLGLNPVELSLSLGNPEEVGYEIVTYTFNVTLVDTLALTDVEVLANNINIFTYDQAVISNTLEVGALQSAFQFKARAAYSNSQLFLSLKGGAYEPYNSGDIKNYTFDEANPLKIKILGPDNYEKIHVITFEEKVLVPPPVVVPPVITLPPASPAPIAPIAAVDTKDQVLLDGEMVSQVVVSLERIKNEKDEIFVEGQEAVLFDEEILNYLNDHDKEVQVKFEDIIFNLGGGHLGQFSKQTLTIKVKPFKNTTEGSYFDIDMFAGQEKIGRLEQAIPMVFKTNMNYNSKYTGVYYYNDEKKQWIFAGGQLNNGLMSFEIRHFSKYKLLQQFKSFEDIKRHWGQSSIEALASRDIIKGVSEENFSPETTLTVAEFIALTVRGLDLSEADSISNYKNLSSEDWYYQVINDAASAGLLSSTFGVLTDFNRPILREEMTGVLARAYSYIRSEPIETKVESLYLSAKDFESIHPMFRNSVSLSYEMKWIEGDDQGNFNPKATATRAEAAAVIERLLKTLKFM